MAGCSIPSGVHCQDEGEGLANSIPWDQCTYEPGVLTFGDSVVPCVRCYIPHHCDTNNVCVEGTTGPTCERCDVGHGYEPVGGSCLPCWTHNIPYNAVVLLSLILIVAAVSAKRGFSQSIFVKLSLLAHYIHVLWLTVEVRMVWPVPLLQTLQSLSFTHLNSQSFSLGCYVDITSIHIQVEWTSTVLVLITGLAICGLVDYKHMKLSVHPDSQAVDTRRSYCRRIAYVMVTWSYFPLVKSSFKTFACAKNIGMNVTFGGPGSDLYLYDQTTEHDCITTKFQLFHLLGTLTILTLAVVVPFVSTIVVLKSHKHGQLQDHASLRGFLYDPYKAHCSVWDTVVMMRTSLVLCVLLVYPLSELVQLCTVLSATLLYTLLLIILRPYRPCAYKKMPCVNIHLVLEVFGCLAALLVQVYGLLRRLLVPSLLPDYLDSVTALVVVIPLVLWFVALCCTGLEDEYPQLTVKQVSEIEPTEVMSLTSLSRETTDDDEIPMRPSEIARRQHALNF